jgi:hypothetical protein
MRRWERAFGPTVLLGGIAGSAIASISLAGGDLGPSGNGKV